DPETIWVTELWRSQEDVDAALQSDAAEASIAEVRDLMDAFQRIDLEPLGGVGHLRPEGGFTVVALDAVEDQAPKHGLGEMGESRFPRGDLGLTQTGLSHQRLRPGRRQAFAHRHRRAEEVYVVLSGSGRVRIEDEVVDLAPRDAVRIAPASTRMFEAGPEGLELLVMGPRVAGDAVPVQDFEV
ncbi:MAG TPA: cupin domain-containing protein, partial [Solirubrobacteraceae bacterium]|nr:cupin domain-containing protein [Solirubrobacteraceae bacterium]